MPASRATEARPLSVAADHEVVAARRPSQGRAPSGGLRRVASILRDARAGLAIAELIATAVACINPVSDPDLWWHLRTGQFILDSGTIPRSEMYSYTATGHSQTFASWLAEVIYALLYRIGGLLSVALFMAAVAWSGFVALVLRARLRGASWLAMAAALLLAAAAAQPVMGTRTQVWSFGLTCWTLYIAERALRGGGRWAWLLPPIFLLWANLHAGFVIGWGLLVLVLLIEAGSAWRGLSATPAAHLGRLAGALVVSAAAACVTPFGPSIWAFAATGGSGAINQPIVEWHSPNFHNPVMWPLLILIAALVLLRGVGGGRTTIRDGVLDAAGIVLALAAVRNTQVLIAVATPTLALLIDGTWSRLRLRTKALSRPRDALIGLAAIAVAIIAVAMRINSASFEVTDQGVAYFYPTCVAQRLADAPGAAAVRPVHRQRLFHRQAVAAGTRVHLRRILRTRRAGAR